MPNSTAMNGIDWGRHGLADYTYSAKWNRTVDVPRTFIESLLAIPKQSAAKSRIRRIVCLLVGALSPVKPQRITSGLNTNFTITPR